jgi:hypothetical protein
MANITVSVTDANNITVQLTPVAAQNITIDRGVAGNGIVSIVPVTITTLQYLRITYTNGTVQDVGPLTSTAYTGDSPITIVGNTISLATVPISKGGTNAITAAAAIQNLLPSYTGNGSKRLGLNSGATALEWVADGGGTVTSVDVSGGTTGLTTSGGPITGSGTITLTGTLATTNGGTGLTAFTANGLVYASSTSALATNSALTWNGSALAVTGTLSATSTVATATAIVNTTNANGTFLQIQLSGTPKTYFGSSVAISGVGTSSDTDVYATGKLRLFGDNQVTNYATMSSTGLAVTGTLSSSTDATVGTAGGTRTLTIGNPAVTGAGFINLVTSSSFKNWQIASNQYVTGLSFTPSTAVGGTTFTTPVLNILDTGIAVTGTLSATTSITSIGSVGNVSTDSTGARLNFSRGADNYFQASTAGGYFAWVVNGSGSNAMTLDSSGNLGLGVTPSIWSFGKAIETGFVGHGIWGNAANETILMTNAYFDSAWKYSANSQFATHYAQRDGQHVFYNAPQGGGSAAGTNITFTQAMTLDASGRLSINQTSSIFGAQFEVTGTSGGQAVGIHGRASDGLANIVFGANGAGTEYARIQSDNTSSLQFGAGSTGATKMTLTSNGVLALSGASTTATGVGITFPSGDTHYSSNANTLDDYEEGTWTPFINFGGVSGISAYNAQNGTYTKIGNMVTVRAYIAIGTKSGATGAATFGGMPFPTKIVGASDYHTAYMYISGGAITGAPMCYIAPNTNFANLGQTNGSTGYVTINQSNFANGTDFIFQATYLTA